MPNIKNIKNPNISQPNLSLNRDTSKEILPHLAAGATLKVTVVEVTNPGSVLLQSIHGKFTMHSDLKLAMQDQLTIQFTQDNAAKQALLIQINNTPLKPPISVDFMRFNDAPEILDKQEISTAAADIKSITATLTYLNLSKFPPKSSIVQLLNNYSQSPNNISLKLNLVEQAQSYLPYSFTGVISEVNADHQLLTTDFGILKLFGNFKLNQQLTWQICELNQQSLKAQFEQHLLNFLQKLTSTISNLPAPITPAKAMSQLRQLIHAANQSNEFKSLTNEYNFLKQILMPMDLGVAVENNPLPTLAFRHQDKIVDLPLSIATKLKNTVFTIDVPFDNQLIKLTGTITIDTKSQTIKNFHLSLSSSNDLPVNFTGSLTKIYHQHQKLSRFQGALTIKTTV